MLSRENTRESILDAVERLIQRYGYRKTTVDDIAEEAGVGKGTIYLYFSSKEEIALSWMDRSSFRLQEKLSRIAESSNAPAEKLRSMLMTRVMHRFDAAQNLLHSLDELFASIRPSILDHRLKNHEREAHIISAVLAEGQRRGDFMLESPFKTAEAMLIATNSLMPYSLSTAQLGRREEIEAKTYMVVELILSGLLRRDAGKQVDI